MANNLKDHLKEVADAIRAKKGTTDLINPQDFATEIEGISGGGGDTPSGGGSNIEYEYYVLSEGWLKDLGGGFPYLSSLVKTTISGAGVVIAPVSLAKLINDNKEVVPDAIAIDMSLMTGVSGQFSPIKDTILKDGVTEETLAKYRITKEQFYDLNA